MRSALSHRPQRAPNASDGSRTLTITERNTEEEGGPSGDAAGGEVGTIRVKASKKKPNNGQRVAWDEGVVDNEGCGKKKSKICCIYHKPRRFDESSSEESDSSDGEDSDASYSGARPSRGYPRTPHPNHNHNHNHNHDHDHDHDHAPSTSSAPAPSSATTVIHTPSETQHEPNAYEKQPKGKKKA